LDLHNFGKGDLWVNGHCLGRYWNIGPTQTAYAPGCWLHAGKNQIVSKFVVGFCAGNCRVFQSVLIFGGKLKTPINAALKSIF